mmetsp:Transcript_40924/g.87310  ORF Transcript_40924/g.87310 Transcript_40924/m.87310 type:complete len:237 (-) Transcript_40924:531-1241(-)
MDVELLHRDGANLLLARDVFLVELVRVERGQVGEDLPREGLVELDDIHVLEREPGHVEHLGGGVRGPEQEVLKGIARDEGPLTQEGLGLEAEFLGLRIGHDEGRGRAVGEEGAVGRGDRAVRLDEGGLEGGHLLVRRVPADATLSDIPIDCDDLLLIDTVSVRLGGELVGAKRVLVLRLSADAEAVAESVGVVPHDLARGKVGDSRGLGGQIFGLHSLEERELLAEALGLARAELD